MSQNHPAIIAGTFVKMNHVYELVFDIRLPLRFLQTFDSCIDTFMFAVGYEQDTVTDFVVGADKIQIGGLVGFDDFSDVQSVMT
jgi:hypothetical protein